MVQSEPSVSAFQQLHRKSPPDTFAPTPQILPLYIRGGLYKRGPWERRRARGRTCRSWVPSSTSIVAVNDFCLATPTQPGATQSCPGTQYTARSIIDSKGSAGRTLGAVPSSQHTRPVGVCINVDAAVRGRAYHDISSAHDKTSCMDTPLEFCVGALWKGHSKQNEC